MLVLALYWFHVKPFAMGIWYRRSTIPSHGGVSKESTQLYLANDFCSRSESHHSVRPTTGSEERLEIFDVREDMDMRRRKV